MFYRWNDAHKLYTRLDPDSRHWNLTDSDVVIVDPLADRCVWRQISAMPYRVTMSGILPIIPLQITLDNFLHNGGRVLTTIQHPDHPVRVSTLWEEWSSPLLDNLRREQTGEVIELQFAPYDWLAPQWHDIIRTTFEQIAAIDTAYDFPIAPGTMARLSHQYYYRIVSIGRGFLVLCHPSTSLNNAALAPIMQSMNQHIRHLVNSQ